MLLPWLPKPTKHKQMFKAGVYVTGRCQLPWSSAELCCGWFVLLTECWTPRPSCQPWVCLSVRQTGAEITASREKQTPAPFKQQLKSFLASYRGWIWPNQRICRKWPFNYIYISPQIRALLPEAPHKSKNIHYCKCRCFHHTNYNSFFYFLIHLWLCIWKRRPSLYARWRTPV